MVAADVATVLALWVLCYAIFSGIGIVVSAAAGFRATTWRFAWFWIGWAVTIAALQVTHLVRPVGTVEQVAVIATGLTGLFVGRRAWRSWPTGSRGAWLGALVLFFVSSYVARHGLVSPRAYDTGTYHLPTVVWMNAFPIVPGLGNLHVRLAFNNSVLLYNALLNAGPAAGFTLNLSLGLLLSAIAAELAFTASAVDRWRRTPGLASACLVAMPFLLAQTYKIAAEGLSPDLVLYACGLEIAVLLLRCAALPEADDDDALHCFAGGVLAVVACTIKLSVVVFAGGTILWFVISRRRAASVRARAVAGVIAAAASTAWVLRSVVLSGYPLFPSPLLPLPLPWRIPFETVRQNFGWIRAWARLINDDSMRVPFEQILSSSQWFRPWFLSAVHNLWDVSFPVAMMLATLAAAVALRPLRRAIAPRQLALLAIPVASLAWWFVSSPDVRFAGSQFVMTAMFGCAVLLDAASATGRYRAGAIAIVCAISLTLAGKQAQNMWHWWRVWPSAVSFGVLPVPSTTPFLTDSGVQLQVPVADEACWSAPPPCSPYPSRLLRLNSPGHLRSGFRVAPFRDDVIVGWWTAAK